MRPRARLHWPLWLVELAWYAYVTAIVIASMFVASGCACPPRRAITPSDYDAFYGAPPR
jgi:hypothetical protein